MLNLFKQMVIMMVKKQMTHVAAATSILAVVKASARYRLTRTAHHKLSISEKKEFDRVFSDWTAGEKYKRSIGFIESMSTTKRAITQPQKDWLFKIACEYGVDYDKTADKTATKKVSRNEEEPDMPTQRADGSWYDAETGLAITNRKWQKR